MQHEMRGMRIGVALQLMKIDYTFLSLRMKAAMLHGYDLVSKFPFRVFSVRNPICWRLDRKAPSKYLIKCFKMPEVARSRRRAFYL